VPATGRDAAAALVPLRADIVDRNGTPLARTIDAWSIGVHPDKVIGDKGELALKLEELMPETPASEYRRLLELPVSFTYLKRRAMPELVAAVNALGEPGIAFAREPERLYPQSAMASHVLGFLNIDGQGMRGMERVLDARLTDPAMRGQPVALSLDARVQAAVESELGQAMVNYHAKGAAGIVLDVHTGEIVAMASLPAFNPNRVGRVGDDAMRNNVTQSVYELGSAFKPIAMATAINDGIVTDMARRFDATAPLQVGRYRIRDDHSQKRWLNIPEILIHSSNIGTARVADLIGQQRMEASFRKLGFDTAPDIEIKEKQRSIWPTYWARTTTMTVAYGHGIAVTPLHLASAYAALVNGGVWRPATLMKVQPGHAAEGRRAFSQATSDRMRQLLRVIVTDGTGRKAEAPGYRVGGKTGTAEVPQAGGYSRNRNVSTFAAAFPMDAPRYVVIMMIDSAERVEANSFQTTAAYTAAPVVSRVIQRTGAMLGVAPDMARDVNIDDIRATLWHAPGAKPAAPSAAE
jgi:cell division protein FtsI (penicillin-binding protein 3)